MRQHVGGFVDGGDLVSQFGQRVGQPSGAGTEIQHRAVRRDLTTDQFQVRAGRQPPEDLDGASIGRGRRASDIPLT
ncbi:hypothetical protein [Mycobacterium gordonae]|uniref:hypothetical protein n=1 Tax=Mycobacterium gordonae TaxID=1778 RepID=UPI001E2ED2D4|nr:hypothetical protein [Mycobacterium gordonae]MCQ4365297.1 hypothetical protein [Mycobacterium gordonae]